MAPLVFMFPVGAMVGAIVGASRNRTLEGAILGFLLAFIGVCIVVCMDAKRDGESPVPAHRHKGGVWSSLRPARSSRRSRRFIRIEDSSRQSFSEAGRRVAV